MVAVEAPVAESQVLRIGARVLDLLAVPLNGMIVRALARGALRQSDLRRELGNPAETTLRGHLARLEELGAVQRRVWAGGPQFARNELTATGIDLLIVTRALEGWLSRAPQEPIRLGTVKAKGAVKALVGAWDSMLMRVLAAKPLTLTQLDRLIGPLSYPALERRLGAMRTTGLAEATPGQRGTPYTVTHWARLAAGPIVAATFFECLRMADAAPIAGIDVEAAFLLAVPIAPLPAGADGLCSLAAEMGPAGANNGSRHAGVEVTVDRGRIVSCTTKRAVETRNYAVGPGLAWLEALIYRRPDLLQIGGDSNLASSLIHGVHEQLFDSARHVP
jgi:DNA-binding HxlR family transcriptional regulator